MKRFSIALAAVIVLAWAGYLVSATTFTWSNPQTSTGTLTIDGVTLTGATVSGVSTSPAAITCAGTGTFTGDFVLAPNATTEEITIGTTNATGAANVPLIAVTDARTGANANTAGEATLKIDAEGTHAIGVIDGIVAIESVLDTYAAGALSLGTTTATSVDVGVAGTMTTVKGTLNVDQAVTLDSTVSAEGTVTFTGDFVLAPNATTDEITIGTTNATGASGVPFIAVTDARTGANANSAAEATLVLTSSGTHALNVASGISALQAVTTTEATIDGKYAVVGTDATTGLMIATGSTTNAGTVTWGAVFGSQTPFVVATVQGAATNATGGYAACRITSRNATNAVIACDGFIAGAAATVHVIAVGARP